MPKRGIVLMGQSNGFAGYADDRRDQLRSHPNLWQFKQDRTFQQAPTMPLDFQSIGNPNRVFVHYAFMWARDYLIPRNPGVDYCILPQSVGGTGFSLWWHAPNAALNASVGVTGANVNQYPLGGTYHENTITQMNAFLAAEAGNTIDCVILQNGEQETGDAGTNIGYYHASFGLTDKQAYTRYVTEMIADIVSRTGGSRTWPFLIGQPPPELAYPPAQIGPAADGGDHSNSGYIPFMDAIKEMPASVSNCSYLDSLLPNRVYCHDSVRTDGGGNIIMDSGNYWLHTSQAGHHVMAHAADRAYAYRKNGKRVISVTYGIAAGVAVPDVPTLALVSASNDNRPDFDIGIPTTAQVGDIIRVQANSVDYAAHTIISADFTTSTMNQAGVTALADGSYIYRARIERGSAASAWSATVSGTIDTVLPVLTSATGSAPSNTTATVSVSTNKAGGLMYWVVTASTTKPTAAQVKAGQDQTGTAALAAGSEAVTVTGVLTDTASNLITSGTRYAHFMQEDAGLNQSLVATSTSWTQVGGAWTIADLSPALWIDVSDSTTLFQNIAGTVAANTNGQPVGTIKDKSTNGFHLTASADDTTRPLLQGVGTFPYLDLDGANDKLQRLFNLGLYTGGAATVFIAIRGNPGGVNKTLVVENSATAIMEWMNSNQTVASTLSMFARADDGGTQIISRTGITELNAFDNTDNVVGVTDSGTVLTSYMDGVSTDNLAYTRSAVLTPTKFGLGADVRSTGAGWFACRVYALVAVKRVIDASERAKLVTALAAKMGRTL